MKQDKIFWGTLLFIFVKGFIIKTFGNFDDIYEVEFPSIKKVMALSWIVMQNGNETMVWFVIPSSNKIDSLRLFIRPKDKKEWQEL